MTSWNQQLGEWEFVKGDNAWFVAGYEGNGLLIVRVEILDVDYSMRKRWGEIGQLGYWIDEPCDAPVLAEDLFAEKDDALFELEYRVKVHNHEIRGEVNSRGIGPNDNILYEYEPDLEEDRNQVTALINQRWIQNNWFLAQHLQHPPVHRPYPKKEKGVDWFLPITKPKRVQ